MFKLWLIAGMLAVVDKLVSRVGQPQQVAREPQDHDAERRRFGAAIDTPTYLDCRAALRGFQQLEHSALSPRSASTRHEADGLAFHRDSRKEKQRAAHGKGSEKSSCVRIKAGQSIVFECGLRIPLTELPTGLDP